MKTDHINFKASTPSKGRDRRQFLKLSGIALAGSALLIACNDDDDSGNVVGGTFDLGSGNVGILNYAFALEQLEAAFYDQVLKGSYFSGAPDTEKQIFQDLYNHEVIHREFFKTAISSAVAAEMVLPDLEFDFSTMDFSSREMVLNTSIILEDTGVSAYNGAGKLIDVSNDAGKVYLGLAGKIVSVEARHASALRNLKNPGSTDFAGDDILVGIDGSGKAFDKATLPAEVLAAVAGLKFIVTPFTANNLPSA